MLGNLDGQKCRVNVSLSCYPIKMIPTITTTLTSHPRKRPSENELGFGKYFSDHMFVARFNREKGWFSAAVQPYQSLQVDPAASVLHYGQALFEGMKAFRQVSGRLVMFRPEFNWARLNAGAERLCMQAPPKELMLEGLKELIDVDQEWVPKAKGTALYLRPTLIATEPFLGVRPADEYLFFIILSPVGNYYSEGSTAIKIWVEQQDLRAAPGGLGATKAAANYAASLRAAVQAKKNGYSQVLWLDHLRKNIEEVGTMNVFFVFNDQVATPKLNGSILAGGTRDCAIQLLKESGKKIVEREISLAEVQEGLKSGRLKEAFGTGTAAVITPIGELAGAEFKSQIGDGGWGPLSTALFRRLSEIQKGEEPDRYGWIVPIK